MNENTGETCPTCDLVYDPATAEDLAWHRELHADLAAEAQQGQLVLPADIVRAVMHRAHDLIYGGASADDKAYGAKLEEWAEAQRKLAKRLIR